MTLEEVRKKLSNYNFISEFEIPHGYCIRLTNGATINVFNTGKVTFQGKHQEEMKAVVFSYQQNESADTPPFDVDTSSWGLKPPIRSFSETDRLVVRWAIEKGITKKSSKQAQGAKTIEEMGELSSAILKGQNEAILSEIGDVLVTMSVQCEINGTVSLEHCYENWYNNNCCYRDYRNTHSQLIEVSTMFTNALHAMSMTDFTKYMTSAILSLGLIAETYNSTLEECYQIAYDKIAMRSGTKINGVFVKSDDLNTKQC